MRNKDVEKTYKYDCETPFEDWSLVALEIGTPIYQYYEEYEVHSK